MAVFLGDIAFYMATLVFAVGIYMIHHAKHHDSEQCKLLKSGGYVVTTIAVLGMLCTGFYWMKFYYEGAYNSGGAYSMNRNMMGGSGHGHMMPGVMENMGSMRGMMMNNLNHCTGKMQGKMMGAEMMQQMQECMQKQMSESSVKDK